MQLKNIVFVLLVVYLLGTTGISAQTDSVPENYFTAFEKNLSQLAQNYVFKVENSFPGKFKSEQEINFSEKYQSLQLTIFPELMDRANLYFQFFNSLPESDRKNLIHLFSYYEKDFETILKKEQLPAELKYLAPTLSAMNEKAISEHKAGIWQLNHFQAVLHGGEINQLIDDRLNIFRSTQLAANELSLNTTLFNSTELAVIAFLCGNTKLKNVLSEIGENAAVSEISEHLSENVSDVLAAFQAMCVFLSTNTFQPEPNSLRKKIFPDTVLVFQQLHFQQIEKVIGVKTEQIQNLNPQYKYLIVPENQTGQKLALPAGKGDDFILWNDSIKIVADSSLFQLISQKIEYPPAPNRQYLGEPVKDLVIEGKTKIQYRIKTGDVLGIIAEKYDVDISDLKYWNNIENERRIQAGQKIDIFVSEEETEYYQNLENQEPEKVVKTQNVAAQIQKSAELNVYGLFDTSKKIEHVVKSGESPFVIAKQYAGVTPELILEWNNIDDPRKIQIGQKLIIYNQK